MPFGSSGGGGAGGAPSGAAGGALGGSYPNPSFAVDMATQAELDTHAALLTAHGLVPPIVKTADQTLTQSSTTAQDVTSLVLPVLANEVWVYELTLYLIAAGGNVPDWKFGWGTPPSGTTMDWGSMGAAFADVGTAGTVTALVGIGTTIARGSSNQNHGIVFRGRILVSSTAGNVQFQASQNTSDASNNTILKGSHMTARKIA